MQKYEHFFLGSIEGTLFLFSEAKDACVRAFESELLVIALEKKLGNVWHSPERCASFRRVLTRARRGDEGEKGEKWEGVLACLGT